MTQYIDKSDLVAEIERLKSIQLSIFSKGETEESCYKALSCISVYNEVLSLLDTFEMREVDFDDFGFYWGEYVSNLGGDINNYEVAKYFYELGLNSQTKDMQEALRTEYEKGRADVIAKTLEWINVFNDNNYIMQYSDSCEHPINEIIEWYKNYINRE